MKYLEEMIEYLKKRYQNPSILIVGDFSTEEQGKEIKWLKEEHGGRGIKDLYKKRREEMDKGCFKLNNLQKRRIDFLLYKNVRIQEVMIDKAIGNSDHRSIRIQAKLELRFEVKHICQMSKKYFSNKILEINLEEFQGVNDYLLLSKWLELQIFPSR